MTTQIESIRLDDVIRMEGDLLYSREICVIKTGVGLTTIGMILEEDVTPGKKIQVATAANADSIALEIVDATSADANCLCLVRHSVVAKPALDYNSLTEADVDNALAALGIVVRSGPTYTTL